LVFSKFILIKNSYNNALDIQALYRSSVASANRYVENNNEMSSKKVRMEVNGGKYFLEVDRIKQGDKNIFRVADFAEADGKRLKLSDIKVLSFSIRYLKNYKPGSHNDESDVRKYPEYEWGEYDQKE